MTKIAKKKWSQADLDDLMHFIKSYEGQEGGLKTALTEASQYFGVTYMAVQKRYTKYLKGQQLGHVNPSKKSRFWSKDDMKIILDYITKYGVHLGSIKAAKHFKVTLNAVKCKYDRYLKRESMKYMHKNGTVKVPAKSKKRKPYKKRIKSIGDPTVLAKHTLPVIESKAKNEVAFDIKDFRIDLKTKKLIITF
jgi:hypothetical protein